MSIYVELLFYYLFNSYMYFTKKVMKLHNTISYLLIWFTKIPEYDKMIPLMRKNNIITDIFLILDML